MVGLHNKHCQPPLRLLVALWLQVFLNMQDRLLAQRGKSAWSKDYYMPAPCDGLVAVGAAHAGITHTCTRITMRAWQHGNRTC